VDGEKPTVITSSRFGDVFDGVSYVNPVIIDDPTGEDYKAAHRYAKEHGLHPRYLRWWMTTELDDAQDIPLSNGDNSVIYRGKEWRLNFNRWPNYQTSVWDRTGVPTDMLGKLPLIFDRRNREREAKLVKEVQKGNKRKLPLLLHNLHGHSSPFPARPEVINELAHNEDYFVVDLADYKCHRIYDLLGLFDAATVLVTIDTATLHLAAASAVKVISYVNDKPWSASIPPRNSICRIKYSTATKLLPKLNLYLNSALNT
jgi:hypothetical protein